MASEWEKVKTTLMIPKWVRSGIRRVIAEEDVGMSEWVVTAVVEKLKEHGIYPPDEYTSLQELVKGNLEILNKSKIPSAEIKRLIEGKYPSSSETVLRIALALEMSEDTVKHLATPKCFKDLLRCENLEALVEYAMISIERLEAFRDHGELPTDEELVGLGAALDGFRTEDLYHLREATKRKFKNHKRKASNGNGT